MFALRRRVPYLIPASADFEASSSQHIQRNFGAPTDTTLWTMAFWFKRETTAAEQHILSVAGTTNDNSGIILTSTNHLAMFDFRSAAYDTRMSDLTSINDTNWHHGCVRYDTAHVNAGSRVRLYTDGVLATSFEFNIQPAQFYSSGLLNTAIFHDIGRENWSGTNFFDGLLADVYFFDGQSLGAEHFVETVGGTLVPRHYEGPLNYGNNGFHLNFHDGSALGEDSSGSGNDWTLSTSPTRSTVVPP